MPVNQPADVFHLIEMRGPTECWRWLGGWAGNRDSPRPYFQANGRRTLAYRVVYELVHGIKLAKRELILHSCDQGEAPVGCCNPDHLRIGDPTDNIKDKVFRNRAGLNTTSVMQVKRLLERGDMSHADIAELIGVSRSTITMIATGQRHTYGEHELLTAAQRPPERPQDPQPDESGHVSNVSRDQWNPFAKPSARRRVDFY